MWDNSVFDRAFDTVGLRQPVRRLANGVPGPEFQAEFNQPQRIVLDGIAHTTDYSIEYTTADVQPPLAYDDQVMTEVAKGQVATFRVKDEPLAQGDGYWTRAILERLA